MTVFGGGCPVSLGYSDVPGSSIRITGDDGTVIGRGQLSSYGTGTIWCEFDGTIDDLPTDQDVYYIETGRRGEVEVTHSELEGSGWEFQMSLGT